MRSKNKGIFYDNYILKQLNKPVIKIWSRRSTITPLFLNKTVHIHNGKQFIKQKITSDMIGFKFGEYSFSRKIYHFKKKKK